MKRSYPVVLALTVLFTLLLAGCRNSQPAQIGTVAPDFTLANPDKTITLSQFRGKPVVLNFWATWCPPCIEEVPSLVALQQKLGDKVVILAVSTDVDEDGYRKFVQKNMPGLLTVRDGQNKSNGLYGTYAFPETFIIDREGKIQRKFIGAVNWTSPEILDYLNKL
ncbi:MAG TPA: TlpA disulfide reductase family protein [Clostridia bacterium]|nr:TlpA disulfide reductase family protein [Clostridia bacterium]